MSFVTNAATNTSSITVSLTWNHKIYNKIIHCNNQTKDWTSKIDCIIQAIKVMVELEEKAEELVRITDIINNTIANAETEMLLAEEEYHTKNTIKWQKYSGSFYMISYLNGSTAFNAI